MEIPSSGLRCRPSDLIRREEGTFPLESQSIVCCEASRYPCEGEWFKEYDCTALSYMKFGWKLSVLGGKSLSCYRLLKFGCSLQIITLCLCYTVQIFDL